jgi:hypothetical protein
MARQLAEVAALLAAAMTVPSLQDLDRSALEIDDGEEERAAAASRPS